MAGDRLDVIHAYRTLFRALLRAVQYSSPARYTVRDQLRAAFRQPGAQLADRETLRRTCWFLRLAALHAGDEHRIVRNLLKVAWTRRSLMRTQRVGEAAVKFARLQEERYRHYEFTIAMLNKSMGLCLR